MSETRKICKSKFDKKYSLIIEQNITNFQTFKKDSNELQPLYINLATTIHLKNRLTTTYDQLNLGSSVANALVSAYHFLNPLCAARSRLFLHYNEMKLGEGSTIASGICALKKYGICPENMWQYQNIIKRSKIRPNKKCYAEAFKHNIIDANHITQEIEELKQCLYLENPFVFGIYLFESFESPNTIKTGIVNFPLISEDFLGGHAMLCVGYDDEKSCFIVKNSWSEYWGDGGYCYIPYKYMLDPYLAGDFYCLIYANENIISARIRQSKHTVKGEIEELMVKKKLSLVNEMYKKRFLEKREAEKRKMVLIKQKLANKNIK
jgi:C1A family cysteine protease